MNKTLILAEKPSVGRDIARVMNCKMGGKGYFEGDKYVVTWALGHLVTLADPEKYSNEYKEWKIESLPIMPDRLELVVIKQTSQQYNTVKELLYRKDITEIVIATDAGREGELVARWILDKANVRKPIKRLWISSVTDKAIREGFAKLKDGRQYNNLYESAKARAEADWLVGINATRALTTKYNAQLSCGRVQTPTLAIIAQREEEIRNFRPTKYYGINAEAKGIKLIWQHTVNKDTRIFDKANCEKIYNTLKTNNSGEVIELTKTLKKSYAPALYDLTELQRDANKLFGFSAKETLSIMQRLYENYKVLTYPRTDSRYLSSDIIDTIPERIRACSVGSYARLGMKVLRTPIKKNASFVNDSKVTDHHAIIPTEQSVMITKLSDKERKIYDLVVKRFLAVLYPASEYEQTSMVVRLGNERFVAKGKVILTQGWKEVYDNNYSDDDVNESVTDQVLPKVEKGDNLPISAINITEGETKPPAYFNEATLLSAMENPSKYMDNSNKELIKAIGETGGLGTVATRADIIEKLFNTFLIEKNGKDIRITSKGKQLLQLVPEELSSPELTAQWEMELTQIAKGNLNKDEFMSEIKDYTVSIIKEIKNATDKFRHDNVSGTKCPECGKYLLEVKGKRGKMYVCQDRACGYKKSVSVTTNARCPECHKKLELVVEGEGRLFTCMCGFREKLSVFEERRKSQASNVSKKDVAKYLNKQKKEAAEPVNNAFAQALSNIKLDK